MVFFFFDVNEDIVFLYRDMSGVSFYRWGYWDVIDKIKLNEGLVVVILILVGWNYNVYGFGVVNKNDLGKDWVFLDLFCGIGIILIEVVFMVYEIVFGLFRLYWFF